MLVPLQALIADCRLHEANSAVRPLHQGEGLLKTKGREAVSSEALPPLHGRHCPSLLATIVLWRIQVTTLPLSGGDNCPTGGKPSQS